MLDPIPYEVTDILQCLFDSGIKYSGCNIARSVLTSFIVDGDKTIGKNEDVVRFMKGLLQKEHPPRYSKTCPKISTKMVTLVHTISAPTDYEDRYASELMLWQRGQNLLQKDPPLPRYSKTWDLNIVLRFWEKWWPLSTLNLLQLTMRTAMLLSLCSGKRG